MAGSGTEIGWEYGVGIGIPDERYALAPELSTYTEADPRPGVPVPQNASRLVVQARGEAPAAGTTLEIRTQRGGIVGASQPATYVWRESAGDWYGHDEQAMTCQPTLILEAEAGAVYNDALHPRTTRLPDGRTLLVYQARRSTTPFYRVEARVIETDGTSSAAVQIRGSVNLPPQDGWRPEPVVEPSGRIRVYSWAFDEVAETAQIRCDYSDDDGATWGLASEAVLPEPIDLTSYLVRQIAAAATDGAVGMWVHLVVDASLRDDYRDQIVQYASRDYGDSFVRIDATDEDRTTDANKAGIAPEVLTVDDGLILVTWVAPALLYPVARLIGNPYDSALDGQPIAIASASEHCTVSGTPARAFTTESGLAQDGSGPIYYATRLANRTGAQQILRSDDGGLSFQPLGYSDLLGEDGAPWWYTGSATLRPENYTLAAMDARPVIIGNYSAADTTNSESLLMLPLGGPSTITLPRWLQSSPQRVQVTWSHVYAGFGTPDEASITTATGTTTAATVAPDGLQISTAGEQLYYTETIAGSAAAATNGIIVRHTQRTVSGGSLSTAEVALTCLAEDTVSNYGVEIRYTDTEARVVDAVSGSTLASVTSLSSAVAYEWLVAVANAKASVSYRTASFSGKVRYTSVLAGQTVSNGGGVTTAAVTCLYGHQVTSTSESYVYLHGIATDDETGQQIALAPTNPDDLMGRPWSSAGSPVGTAATVVSALGATIRGDEWEITATSETPIQNVSRGGPRRPFRTSTTAATTLVYDADSGAGGLTDVLVVAGFGCNFNKVRIDGVTLGGTTTTLATVTLSSGMDALPFTVTGDRVQPDTSAASAASEMNTPVFYLGELAGDYFMDDSRNGFQIRRNRGGRWTRQSARNRESLFVRSPSGIGASGSSGAIVPANWAVLVDLRGEEYERITVTIVSDPTTIIPPEGYWQIGRMIVGSMVAHAYHPSWGNRVSEEPIREIVEARDSQRSGIKLGPNRRRFRIGWVDGVRNYNVTNVDFNEDGDWFAVSDHSSSEGMGQDGLVLHSWTGILEATNGGIEPIVYLPYLPRFGSSDRVYLANRREQVGLAYVDSPIVRDRVSGLTMHGDLVRGEIIDLPEAT